MDAGKRYTFNSRAFPRYHYFQSRLKNLVPRWQRILDAGGLPDCILDGVSRLKAISAAAGLVIDLSTVYLFADNQFLRANDLQLSVETDSSLLGDVSIQAVNWQSFKYTLPGLDLFQPSVVVIVRQRFDDKVTPFLSEFSEDQLGNVIIYNTKTRTNVLYTDLAKAGFSIDGISFGDGKAATRHSSLAAQIQFILEGKAVSGLEEITDYIHPFVPKPQQDLKEPLLELVYYGISDGLKDQYVVSDLVPAKTDPPVVGRQMKDEDFTSIALYIGSHWHLVARELGLSDQEIDEIKQTQHGPLSKVARSFTVWKDKVGDKATLLHLLEVLEKVSEEISDTFKTDAIISMLQTDADRNEIFHQKLNEFVKKKSRCITCSKLSTKYGIPEHIVNEFLNDGFFGFEKKVASVLEDLTLPTYPGEQIYKLIDACGNFSFQLGIKIEDTIKKVEEYVKAKLRVLDVMMKLQFELFGMLRLADVEVHVSLPPLTELSSDLQETLLETPDVEGCGTFYGELRIHVTELPSQSKKDEIKELLEAYNYHGGYKFEVMLPRVEQVMGNLIEPGQAVRARCLLNPDPHIYGSLGCFVKVSPRVSNAEQKKNSGAAGTKVSDASMVTESRVHAITCAHCVKDCDDMIEVKRGDEFVLLGQKKLEVYFRDLLDVATIDVDNMTCQTCDSKLKRFDELCTCTWTCFTGNPGARQVHKEGSVSKFTKGIVMCTDYSNRLMLDHKLQRLKNNILIESLADVPQGTDLLTQDALLLGEPFSERGDSGAVVCADNPEDNSVFIVSLLIGAVSKRDEPGAVSHHGFKFSYSSKFEDTLENLRVQYDVNIEPAILKGPPPGAVGVSSRQRPTPSYPT